MNASLIHRARRWLPLLLVAGWFYGLAGSVLAAGTVGSGSPASCTEAALDAALIGGGVVDFDCGAAPVGIFLTSNKFIVADTMINGGGRVTLDGGGGGFSLFSVNDGSSLNVSSIILRNAAGAIIGGGGGTGGIGVHDSTISDHHGVFDGAINGAGTIIIGSSTINRNTYTATAPGAGIHSHGSSILIVTDSEISGNIQNNGGGAGIYISSNNAFISNCLFTGNSATGSSGAALRNDGNGTQIINSTFTGNDSFISTIENIAGSLTIDYSTIAGNATTTGISNQQPGVPLTLRNSIIANNAYNCNGTITDGGHNLQFGGAFVTCGAGIPVSNPALDILEDNGGNLRTMALLPGSAAIDGGNPSTCPSTDQRGFSRPFGAACDIGAFEWRPDALFQNGFE